MKNKRLLILGMHRSGTSCLAGSLSRSGVYFGSILHKGKYNRKGYYEIKEVQTIHDQILRLNNSTWYDPNRSEVIVHPHHRQQLLKVYNSFSKHDFFGVKDPRILLILKFYKELFFEEPLLVGTFRNPSSVAESLFRRNKIPSKLAHNLWRTYNKKLIDEHTKNPFPLIQFDPRNKKQYITNIQKITNDLGLKVSKMKLNLFVEKSMDHSKNTAARIPEESQSMFNYLLENQVG